MNYILQPVTMKPPMKKEKPNNIALGILFGTVIGIAMDNTAVGITLGLACGAAIEYSKRKNKKDD